MENPITLLSRGGGRRPKGQNSTKRDNFFCNLPLGKGAEKNQKNPSMMDFALHIHTYIKIHHFLVFFPSDGGKLSMKTTVEKKRNKNPSFHIFRLHIHT